MKRFIGAVALSFLAVSGCISAFPASAESVKGYGVVCGMIGDCNQWDKDEAEKNGSDFAVITGDGQYEASWKVSDKSEKIDFLMLEIRESEELKLAFTSDCLPDLSLKIDSVTIDGKEMKLNGNEKAYNLAYYETEVKRGSRAYLADGWGINEGGTLGIPEDTPVNSEIRVKFTVSGINDAETSGTETGTSAVSSDIQSKVEEVPQTGDGGIALTAVILSFTACMLVNKKGRKSQ